MGPFIFNCNVRQITFRYSQKNENSYLKAAHFLACFYTLLKLQCWYDKVICHKTRVICEVIVCDLCLTVLMLTLKGRLIAPIFVRGQLIGNMLKFLKSVFSVQSNWIVIEINCSVLEVIHVRSVVRYKTCFRICSKHNLKEALRNCSC